MTKAEKAARDYVISTASPFPNTETAAVIYGYRRAEDDLIELAQLWRDSGYVNITTFRQFVKMKEEQK